MIDVGLVKKWCKALTSDVGLFCAGTCRRSSLATVLSISAKSWSALHKFTRVSVSSCVCVSVCQCVSVFVSPRVSVSA